MEILRAMFMGLGCFGLLVVASCGMSLFGTVAVMDKAAELAKEERAEKASRSEYSSDFEYEQPDRIGRPATRAARSDEYFDDSSDYDSDD